MSGGLVSSRRVTSSATSTATTAHSVSLKWEAPADNVAVIGYRIQRRTPPGRDLMTIVDNTGSTARSYVDAGLEPGTHYIYRVIALNVVGDEGAASVVQVTTDP